MTTGKRHSPAGVSSSAPWSDTQGRNQIQFPPQVGFDGFDGQAQASRSVLPP